MCTDKPEMTRTIEHLQRAAEQLRRFSSLGFAAFSEPAAQDVEKLANAIRQKDRQHEN